MHNKREEETIEPIRVACDDAGLLSITILLEKEKLR
jgi:hypothetical protein